MNSPGEDVGGQDAVALPPAPCLQQPPSQVFPRMCNTRLRMSHAGAWWLAPTSHWQTIAHCTQPVPRFFRHREQKTLSSAQTHNALEGVFWKNKHYSNIAAADNRRNTKGWSASKHSSLKLKLLFEFSFGASFFQLFLSCFSGCKCGCLFISYCLSSLISCFSLVCCILVCSQLPFFS